MQCSAGRATGGQLRSNLTRRVATQRKPAASRDETTSTASVASTRNTRDDSLQPVASVTRGTRQAGKARQHVPSRVPQALCSPFHRLAVSCVPVQTNKQTNRWRPRSPPPVLLVTVLPALGYHQAPLPPRPQTRRGFGQAGGRTHISGAAATGTGQTRAMAPIFHCSGHVQLASATVANQIGQSSFGQIPRRASSFGQTSASLVGRQVGRLRA
jgi:hypothetical protein